MPLIPQGNFVFLHSNQPDNLSSIMSPSQVKSSFDSQALELKTTLNNAIALLGSVASNDSGAKAIGLEAIAGVTGANVQAAIANLKTQIDTKLGLAGGTVAGTVTVTNLVSTGDITEAGAFLKDKYVLKAGDTMPGALTTNATISQDKSTGGALLFIRSNADNSQIRLITTATNNYIQSGDYSWGNSKNILITGVNGTPLTTFTVNATTTSLQGALTTTGAISTSAGITANGTVIADLAGTGATLISAKNSTDNGQIRFTTAAGTNYLQSGNYAAAAVKNLTINGVGNADLANFTVQATQAFMNGTLQVNGTISEQGITLASRYASLTNPNTFSASQTLSSGGITISEGTISAGSATNDGRIRTAQTATLNYIQSGNNAGSAPKNLTISGYGATTMNECNIVCNTFKIAGQPLQAGVVTIVPVANTPTKVTVTFPTPYSAPPHVIVTAESGVIGSQVMGASVANITSTQCDIYVYRNNTNSTNVHWIAMA